MRFEHHEARIVILLIKNIVEGNIVSQQSQYCIHSAACRIPEGLQGHETPERRVEDVDYGCNLILHQFENVTIWKFEDDLLKYSYSSLVFTFLIIV